ncbi:MAG TPA: CRTAC1 family protein [Fuerstia sp.]|nr:CRTAC1 family protein [Fuerstiella sp.]
MSMPAKCLVILAMLVFGCGTSDSGPEPADSHARMLALLTDVATDAAKNHPFLGTGTLPELKRELHNLSLPSKSKSHPIPSKTRVDLHRQIGEAELRLGQTAEAIRHLEAALAAAISAEEGPDADLVEQIRFRLAVACIRKAEDENCVQCRNGESCLLPIRDGGIHEKRSGSEQAAKQLNLILRLNPKHLSARWLLNVVQMTLGQYPDAVPEHLRIPLSAFESDEEFPKWQNISSDRSLDLVSLSGGVVADDLNGDGWIDILVSSWEPTGQVRCYLGTGDGRFVDHTAESGLIGIMGGLNLVQADYDNDGDVDILVLRGAWLGNEGRIPNSLLQNDGRAGFRDVTFDVGLGKTHFPTQTAAWADYDNDGDVDLFIGNEQFPSQLFRNDGTGHFVDVAWFANVAVSTGVKGVTWGDYNNDRFPDLYVSSLTGSNSLFRNNRDGTFTDVAQHLGVSTPSRSFPCWFWDYNNDGQLDLYVSGYWSNLHYFVADYIGEEHEAETDRLYSGDGEGGFRDVTTEVGLDHVTLPMGSNFGDLDNDGFPDFYLGTGYPAYEGIMPNRMFRNRAGTGFADVTTSGGFGHLQKGHGVAFADFDNDGDQDIFIEMGGAFPGDAFSNALFENPGSGHHWLKVMLQGRESNRLGIGVRLCATIADSQGTRSVYKWVNSGGSFGANPLTCQHIGVGSADSIQVLEVYWPTSDSTQTFTDVSVDQCLQIAEGDDNYQTLPKQLHSDP